MKKNLRTSIHGMVSQFKSNKLVVAAGSLVIASASQAAITAPDFSGNQTDLMLVFGAMLGFAAIVWGARKLLSFVR